MLRVAPQVVIPPSTYSAEAVCSLLDSSLTDSTVSSDDGDSESTSSEYDLSDPEAGLIRDEAEMALSSVRSLREAGTSREFDEMQSGGQDEFDPSNLIQVRGQRRLLSGFENTRGHRRSIGGRGGLARGRGRLGEGRGGMAIGHAESAEKRGGSAEGRGGLARGRGRLGEGRGGMAIGHAESAEKRGGSAEGRGGLARGRGRLTRGHGRSTRARGRSTRARGRPATGQPPGRGTRDHDDHDQQELTMTSILIRTDVVEKVFPFTPERPAGVYLPSETNAANPEHLFKLFFDKTIVENICKASNEYAESLKEKKPVMYKYFRSMDSDDFYKLVAILIHFGYKKIPRYRLAWNTSSLCYDPFVTQIMSRNKFESLMTFLHVVDKETESQLKADNDKLAKVRPLSDSLNEKCRKFCQPNMEVSIDERMVRSKAHFSFKQYIRNKPTKWGFKLWCLCNAKNGYTIRFSVYRGKTGEVVSGNGLGYDVVFSLMTDYLDQGYSLYVDNFYSSPTLATDLFDHKTHITGTLEKKRKSVPDKVKEMYDIINDKDSHRGDGFYVRDGCIVYSAWKDTKGIVVLSTKHPGYSESTVKRSGKDSSGHHEKRDIPIPSPIYYYNQHMGGVDRSDQLIQYYNVLRQTRKYWKTLFFHFIDIAVVNSYILHTEREKKSLTHYTFRETLVKSLSSTDTVTLNSGDPVNVDNHSTDAEDSEDDISFEHHQFVSIDKASPCIYCKLQHKKTSRTTKKCGKCKVPLCFKSRDCFFKWHSSNFTTARKEWLQSNTSFRPRVGRPLGSKVSKGKGKRKRKGW